MIPVDVFRCRNLLSLNQQLVTFEVNFFLVVREAATAETSAATVAACGIEMVALKFFYAGHL